MIGEGTLRDACYRYEQRMTELERLLRGIWREMDAWRLRGALPDDFVDGWRERLESNGVSVE